MAEMRLDRVHHVDLIVACTFMATYIIVLCVLYEPNWATNDDVAMAMAAGGYGLAASSTPNLVFSNVLWGYIVRQIPEIYGTSGYSIATLVVLFCSGTAITHGLIRLGASRLLAFSAVALVMTRPILHPQFTINSGLLMVSAAVYWRVYGHDNRMFFLLAGCVLAAGSFLIRPLEFALVFAAALPWLPYRTLRSQPAAKFAFLGLAAFVVLAAFADHRAYDTPAWSTFSELNVARAHYTDFGAGARVSQHPEVMRQHGYSANDVGLITRWFFVDRDIADPASLDAMRSEAGHATLAGVTWQAGQDGLKVLVQRALLPLMFAAAALLLLRPGWRTVAVWAICLAAMATMGFAGRPGIARACMPLVFLMLLSPLFVSSAKDDPTRLLKWRHGLALALVVAAGFWNAAWTFADAARLNAEYASKRAGLAIFPRSPVVVWGAAFPFQAAYPMLGAPVADGLQLYGLGVLTWAPFTVSHVEASTGRSLVQRLLSERGVAIVARDPQFMLLDVYCDEHWAGKLQTLSVQSFGETRLRTVRCVLRR